MRIWAYRELLRNLVVRDLKVRYKRSILGVFWALLEPLILMCLFTVVFSLLLRIQVEKYPVFVLCGILPWSFFNTALAYSATSIVQNAPLIKKIYFPREIIPLAVVISRLVHFLISLVVLLIFLFIFKINITFALIYLPLIIIIQFIFIVGLSLFFAALNTFYNDVGFILQFILFGWFYLNPIFYPLSMVPERYLTFYMLNPMAAIIYSYRNVLFCGLPPQGEYLLMAVVMSLVALLVGVAVFHRLQFRFAEVL